MPTSTSPQYSNGKKIVNGLPTGLTISIIGCGTIGSAILGRLMEACERGRERNGEAPFDRFFATVNSEDSRFNLLNKFSLHQPRFRAYCRENDIWMDTADVVILAFKPCMMEQILGQKGVRDALADKLVISLIVGASTPRLLDVISKSKTSEMSDIISSFTNSSNVPTDKPPYIKRAIVNIAAEYGQSITIIENSSSDNLNNVFENLTKWMFEQCGKVSFIATEDFEIGGVLSSASGALLSVALDGLLDGAVAQGLKRTEAKDIVAQSLISLATMIQNGTHPAVMRENFSSPQGTTISGLISLEEDRVRWAYCKAAITSSKRSKEIGDIVRL